MASDQISEMHVHRQMRGVKASGRLLNLSGDGDVDWHAVCHGPGDYPSRSCAKDTTLLYDEMRLSRVHSLCSPPPP